MNDKCTGDLFDITQNYHGGNECSDAAHESILADKQRLQLVVLGLLREAGEDGRTSDEVEEKTGMPHQTVSARFTELKAKRWIEPAGKRPTRSGRLAMAWRCAA